MIRYAVTIFLSAFLLFQVQPLIGKFILPWFGGTPSVWTTCMLFFQVVLLGGYSYAHFLTDKLSPRWQRNWHVALLFASLAFLPIAPNGEFWKPRGEDLPIWEILGLLLVTIGLPYFLLSSTGPLLQEGFRRETGRTPYRLYSLSNAGSLLALLTYPFMFEPTLTLQKQIWGWSVAYVVFVVFCGWCALNFTRPAHVPIDDPQSSAPQAYAGARRPGGSDILFWLALAACGSVMLLATTNQLCQEVSAVPFLWVVPLAVYLVSFIICFDHERWYHRTAFMLLLIGAVLAACYGLREGTGLSIAWQLMIFSTTLWVCCMVLHGELVRAKPAPSHATLFYLMVSAGGALGGILVAFVAPMVLKDYWEYHIGLAATVVLAFWATCRGVRRPQNPTRARWLIGATVSVALGLGLGWAVTTFKSRPSDSKLNLDTTRNFYGVLRVNMIDDPADDTGAYNELIHGRIRHGYQFLDADRARLPTTYYSTDSGVGLAIEKHPRRATEEGMRIGVIGLGCGTLAAYGRKGDTVRFYEINPDVLRISEEFFTYRSDSEAKVDVVLGDARITMERQLSEDNPQEFDVLAVDAFSSDSIPVHLLTVECGRVFQKHLKPDGILCLHISNRFLDLSGICRGLAAELGCQSVLVSLKGENSQYGESSSWVLLTKNSDFLSKPEITRAIQPWKDSDAAPLVWTDDYASLWQVLDQRNDGD